MTTETFASRSHSAIEDQINIIETLIARGDFGALIIATVDSKGLGSVLDKASKAGLYIILVDSGVEKGEYVTTIGTNNKVAAVAGAEFALRCLTERATLPCSRVNPADKPPQIGHPVFMMALPNFLESSS